MISSGGITETLAPERAPKAGTIANTGGARSPFRCASIGSLVASA